MKKQLQYVMPSYPSNGFTDEVEIALQSYFERGYLKRNALIGGVPVPLIIQPEHASNGNPIVLLIDGVLTPSALPSYEWEMKWRHYFQRNNTGFSSVYAAQWWKNPKQEVRRLTGQVLRPTVQEEEQKPKPDVAADESPETA
jgi:hypothetical protein